MRSPTSPARSLLLTAALALTAGAASLGVGCGGAAREEGQASGGAGQPAPVVATPAPGVLGTASLEGQVHFAGPPPAPEVFRMTGDSFCARAHAGDSVREDLAVSPEGGLANVFLYLKEGVSGSYPPPAAPVVLDQRGCRYQPHVLGLQVGQPLEIVNSDETIHNVHAVAEKNPSFNIGMPFPNLRERRMFAKPEVMLRVKCDVHGWMSAWIGVVSHPFFAVSGLDGSFRIGKVPAGTYVLEAWHERLGTQRQTVVVGDGETKRLQLSFSPSASGGPG